MKLTKTNDITEALVYSVELAKVRDMELPGDKRNVKSMRDDKLLYDYGIAADYDCILAGQKLYAEIFKRGLLHSYPDAISSNSKKLSICFINQLLNDDMFFKVISQQINSIGPVQTALETIVFSNDADDYIDSQIAIFEAACKKLYLTEDLLNPSSPYTVRFFAIQYVIGIYVTLCCKEQQIAQYMINKLNKMANGRLSLQALKTFVLKLANNKVGDQIIKQAYTSYKNGTKQTEALQEPKNMVEDTKKLNNGKWVNKGKAGTHGQFRTKKAANAQRKAMFANGYHEALTEDVHGNTATFKGKPFVCGSVNADDGVIEEVISYRKAENADWHHSFMFSQPQLDKLDDGDCIFFMVRGVDDIYIDPCCREYRELTDEQNAFYKRKILSQIKYLNKENLEEAENIDEKIEKHDELNPKLFKDNKLLPEVRTKILDLIDLFKEAIADDDISLDVKDIVIVGSNASYNYTEDSDLDIHIITGKIDETQQKLYDLCRSNFNARIKPNYNGIPAEIYIEAENGTRISNGCYSVQNDTWVTEPKKDDIPEVDDNIINEKVKPWEERYTKILKDAEEYLGNLETKSDIDTSDLEDSPSMSNTFDVLDSLDSEPLLTEEIHNKIVDEIDAFIDDVYQQRIDGMKAGGEYSDGNLLFKEIRNRGMLDSMKELKNRVLSKELSVEDSAGYLAGGMPEPFKRETPFAVTKAEQNEVDDVDEGFSDLLDKAKTIFGSHRKQFNNCLYALFNELHARHFELVRLSGNWARQLEQTGGLSFTAKASADDDEKYSATQTIQSIINRLFAAIKKHIKFDVFPSISDATTAEVDICPQHGWLTESDELAEGYLTSKEIYEYRMKIQRLVHEQVLIQPNGIFEITNISEDEANAALRLLRHQDYIDYVSVSAGRFDFRHPNPMKPAGRYANVRGQIKVSDHGLREGWFDDGHDETIDGYLVQNVPDYAADKEFIVARLSDDELWYYGSYATEERAKEVASQLGNGKIIYRHGWDYSHKD